MKKKNRVKNYNGKNISSVDLFTIFFYLVLIFVKLNTILSKLLYNILEEEKICLYQQNFTNQLNSKKICVSIRDLPSAYLSTKLLAAALCVVEFY